MRLSLFDPAHFKESVSTHLRRDVATLRTGQTVEDALAAIRLHGLGERIIYFYVVDDHRRLLGVVPTRRLLTASLGVDVGTIMVGGVVAIRDDATMLEVFEAFHAHKLLALPVVGKDGTLQGAIDLGLASEDLFAAEARYQADAVFESLGIELSRMRDLTGIRATWVRLRWLLVTMASGFLCALLAASFTSTLASGTSLAFFIALVLALGESAGMQTMTITLQSLHGVKPRRRWFFLTLLHEIKTALPLGLASGLLAGGAVLLWLREPSIALILGSAVALSIGTACIMGLLIPTLLHALGLDYKIAASPATLAIADVLTLSHCCPVISRMVAMGYSNRLQQTSSADS